MLGNIVKRSEWPLVRKARYECSPFFLSFTEGKTSNLHRQSERVPVGVRSGESTEEGLGGTGYEFLGLFFLFLSRETC